MMFPCKSDESSLSPRTKKKVIQKPVVMDEGQTSQGYSSNSYCATKGTVCTVIVGKDVAFIWLLSKTIRQQYMGYGRTSANENYVCKTDDRLKDGDDEWINKEIKGWNDA